MDYELLLNEIINIGKEMIKSGAETNRVEDSMYRMLESYDIGQCSVSRFRVIIQVTTDRKTERLLRRCVGFTGQDLTMIVWITE